MKISIDRAAREVSLTVPRGIYSDDAVRIAAHVFSNRAEVFHAAEKGAHALTLAAKKTDIDAVSLEALGGEFLNELLNQEYRFIVARFNRKIADIISAQALLSARGGENPTPRAPDSEELKAETARLMRETADEIRATMPKRIAPQGSPIAPEVHAR